MENSEKKKDEGIGWLTRPIYNIMSLSLVVLFVMQEHVNNNYGDIFHVLLFLSFGIIIILNVWNVVNFFRKSKNPKEEIQVDTEEE